MRIVALGLRGRGDQDRSSCQNNPIQVHARESLTILLAGHINRHHEGESTLI
jgi:hypothetical protein